MSLQFAMEVSALSCEEKKQLERRYEVAQTVAGTERLSVSEQTLRQRLREQGLPASVDAGRQMLQVRRTLGGRPRQVLHLRTSDVLLTTE